MTDRHTQQQINVRLPAEVLDKLRALALAHDLTVNWLIIKAVKEWTDRLLPPEQVKWTRDG